MKENLLSVADVAPKYLLAGLSFLVPLFFLTTNFDYFEYPKQVLIWVAALLLLGLWVLRYALSGKAKLVKTPLDLPWALLIAVIGVSAYLATYKYPAILGSVGRPHPSLVSFVAYALIFYVGANTIDNIKDVRRILTGFIAGTTTLAVMSLLGFFGVYNVLFDATKLAIFQALRLTNPAASATSAAMTLAMAIPATLGWLAYQIRSKEKTNQTTLSEMLLAAALVLMASVFVIFNILAAWVTLIVGLVIFAFWNRVSTLRSLGTYISVALVISVVIGLIANLSFFKDNVKIFRNLPQREIQLGFKDSWVVSIHTVRDRPFFGSGFGSFSSDFTRYRQVGFNLSPNWNLRFNSAYNDYFNYLSMLGIVGFLAVLFFIGKYVIFAVTKALKRADTHEHSLVVGTTAASIAFLVGTLFTASTTTMYFTFVMVALLTTAIVKVALGGLDSYNFSARYGDVVKPSAQPIVLAVPVFVAIALAFFFGGKTVLANYHYRQALNDAQVNRVQGVLTNLTRAIRLDPYVDLYHSELARSSFVIATALARRENLTDQDRQNVQALARQAIDQATVATRLDPTNVANWETLSSIYRSVSSDNQQVLRASLQSLQQAINLDPANPQLRLAIGGIFFAAGAYNDASQIFAQAVSLKPDFANARYNLANSLKKEEKYNQAFAQYEEIKKLVQPGSPDYEKAQAEQDEIRDKVTTQPASQGTQPATGSANP